MGAKWSDNSKFPDGGELKVGDKLVGLRANDNFKGDFPGLGIQDSDGNFLLQWLSVGGNATDYLKFKNAQSGIPTELFAEGASADIGIILRVKGAAALDVIGKLSVNGSTPINEIIDDDTMASATDTNVPTAESVVNYIASVPTAASGLNGQMQYNNAGFLGGDTGFATDGAGNLTVTGSLAIDNLKIDGNTLSSTDTNGNINLTPDGTGVVNPALLTVNNSANIDGIIDDDTMVTATDTNIPTSESVVQYVQTQTMGGRDKIFGLEPNSTYQTVYRVRSIGTGGSHEFTFQIPSDFATLTEVYLVAAPTAAGSSGAGKNIDISSAYGTFGESTTITQENDSLVVDTGTQDVFFKLDVSSVFTSLASDDTVGLKIDHMAVGGNIAYFTLNLIYQS